MTRAERILRQNGIRFRHDALDAAQRPLYRTRERAALAMHAALERSERRVPDSDFWRASNSLQLDETLGLYVAVLLQDGTHLGLVNNRHPLVPLSTVRAGYRRGLHGLAAESLQGLLVRAKRRFALEPR